MKDLAKFRKDNPDMGESAFLDVLLRIRTEMMRDVKSVKVLIPDTEEGLLKAAEKGTARFLLNERPLEWIKENGTEL